jgi:hypothetical protein
LDCYIRLCSLSRVMPSAPEIMRIFNRVEAGFVNVVAKYFSLLRSAVRREEAAVDGQKRTSGRGSPTRYP